MRRCSGSEPRVVGVGPGDPCGAQEWILAGIGTETRASLTHGQHRRQIPFPEPGKLPRPDEDWHCWGRGSRVARIEQREPQRRMARRTRGACQPGERVARRKDARQVSVLVLRNATPITPAPEQPAPDRLAFLMSCMRLQESPSWPCAIDLHQFDSAVEGLSHAIRPNDLAFVCRHPRAINS